MTLPTQSAPSRHRGVEKVTMYALDLASVSAMSNSSLPSPVCQRALFHLAVLDPGGFIFHPCFVGVAMEFLLEVDEAKTNPGHVCVIPALEVTKSNSNFGFDGVYSGPSIGFAAWNMKHMKCGGNCIPYSGGFASGGSQSMGVESLVFKNEDLLVDKGELSYGLFEAISGCDLSLVVVNPMNKLERLMIWCSLDIDVAYDPVQNSRDCLGWVWYQDGFDIIHQGEGVSGNPEIPFFLVD